MLGLTAASVPLYACSARSAAIGGTPRIDAKALRRRRRRRRSPCSSTPTSPPACPGSFSPVQRSMTVPLGEQTLAFFEAVNTADHPVVGHAVFNVTPFKVGPYFVKLQCFCFDEQTLQAGQRVEMPVSFYVDPAMLTDRETSEVAADHSVLYFLSSIARRPPSCRGAAGSTQLSDAARSGGAYPWRALRPPTTTTPTRSWARQPSHPYHLVDPSPWPLVGSLSALAAHQRRRHVDARSRLGPG